jgi:hypothetical protein
MGAAVVLAVFATRAGIARVRRVEADPYRHHRTLLGHERLSPPAGATDDYPVPVQGGAEWLETNQNPDRSWDDQLFVATTGTVLQSLGALDPCTPAVTGGAAWLLDALPVDHDELARQTAGLAEIPGYNTATHALALQLLAVRNPPTSDSSRPNWPEGGWGMAPGYETDCQTTALALLALDRVGFNGGFTATNVSLAGGATNVHVWKIAGDALKARIEITVSGSTVRLRMTQGRPPTAFDPYFNLPPGGPYLIVFPDSGLPFTPGTNYIGVQSPSPPTLAATYSMTASYETGDFDTRALKDSLRYLREAQNPDGGWGLQRGTSTESYTTFHTILALQKYRTYEFGAELADAITWLKARQLPDGSFGYSGTGIPYVTALATLALVRHETPVFGSETDSAVAALLAMQLPDGSWASEPYDTALSVNALWEHDLPPSAEAGNDAADTDVDGNCVESVTLSGSGTANGGASVTGYAWSLNCSPVATGANPTLTLPVGEHVLVLTVTDSSGLTGRDDVLVRVTATSSTICVDRDGDGILDDGDGSGSSTNNPCPTGLPVGCDDNCPLASNADQTDADADAFGMACDCDDGEPAGWIAPGDASIALSHNRGSGVTTISWAAVPAGGISGPVYDTLRSATGSNFGASATCLESDGADTTSTDPIAPAADLRFYYLVGAQNACPGRNLGADSEGMARTGRVCP